MKATQKLHDLGQSLWLDNITRALMNSGTLQRYIDELSVTGLTSNPSIFDAAISKSSDYDSEIVRLLGTGLQGEGLFFELAIQDLTRAADMFAPVFERTSGVDGFVSLEVSPLLAYDTKATTAAAQSLHGKAKKPNLFIKIPGTTEGLPAIEESIAAGVPINVTLLFSVEQYLAAADAYMKGLERRLADGKTVDIRSVASLFVSRWDRAVMEKAPKELHGKLGIAVSQQAYKAYRDLLDSDRWQRLEGHGARPMRLLLASTSMKDPSLPDTLYVQELAAPNTVDTMPEETLLALADHGKVEGVMPRDGGDSAAVLAGYEKAGISVQELASTLQKDGAKSFVTSWEHLLEAIKKKSAETVKAA